MFQWLVRLTEHLGKLPSTHLFKFHSLFSSSEVAIELNIESPQSIINPTVTVDRHHYRQLRIDIRSVKQSSNIHYFSSM